MLSNNFDNFIHANMLLFQVKCQLDKKNEQLNQLEGAGARLTNVVKADAIEFERHREKVNAAAFELLLHTPCRQFAKLEHLLDL